MIAVNELLAQVRANQAKLDGCARHEFKRLSAKAFSRYVCAHCGGEVDGHAVHWYNKGMGTASIQAAVQGELDITGGATPGYVDQDR